MVQKGYILLSGILLLGLFMFMSTIITLENYQQQPSSSQQQHSFYQTTSNHFIFPFSSTSSSNTTSTSNITISSSYDPFLLLKSFLFNSSTATLTSHSSSTTTISDPIYPSYLSYVQNKTLNLWNNVNNQINKLYHYTTWNITESSNSSLYELQLVNIFASQGLGNLRGISNSNPTISDLNHEQNQQQQLLSSSPAGDQSTGIKLYITQAPLHPAVPVDLEEEESESMLKESSCHNNTFQPTCAMYPYVQFWKQKLNYHDCHRSPLFRRGQNVISPSEQRYLVFQPDLGGWNNIRMAAETAMIFALASGRTLVLPPKLNFYLLDKNDHGFNRYLFDSFFDLTKISELVDIISMDDFLKILATDEIKKLTPEDLNGMSLQEFSQGGKHLWKYFEKTCYIRDYHPGRVFFGFNLSHDPSHRFGDIQSDERLKRHAAHKRDVIVYNEELDSKFCIYFPGDYREEYRILTHFYAYLYWANPHEERIYKRLVRDRLHYIDSIFCGAGRAVQVLHEESYNLMPNISSLKCGKRSSLVKYPASVPTSPPLVTCQDSITLGGNVHVGPTYHAIHIRRGDFQYKHTRLTAEQIWNNIKHLLNTTVTRILYIATDERDKSFFAPFHQNFQVRFFDDIAEKAHLVKGKFDQNHIGMVEQIICANAHTFIGTPLSTFTGYITRMRGYYRDGRYANTFYTMPDAMYQLQLHPELVGPFWAREFAVAHRNIDDDYNVQQSSSSSSTSQRH